MYSIVRLVAETATCFGSGVLGLSYVLVNGSGGKIFKYITFSSIGAGIVYSLIQRNRQKTVNERNVILITGCDSGLGLVESFFFFEFILELLKIANVIDKNKTKFQV